MDIYYLVASTLFCNEFDIFAGKNRLVELSLDAHYPP